MRPYTPFGVAAWNVMKQKGITLKSVAEHVEVSPQYISNIFAGKTSEGKMFVKRTNQIAEFLGIKL